ncbi:MAG: hypothetical protein JWQ32_1190 [Marmoricola sp.]|nr:hypothetical protein [Marmoricola sp.]
MRGARSSPSACEVEQAAGFIYDALLTASPPARVARALRSPGQTWAAARVLASLPAVDVVSASRELRPPMFYSPFEATSRLRRAGARLTFSLRLPQVRIGRAVLALPDCVEDYLRGRSRQTVRTACTRGRTLGMEVRPVAGEGVGARMIGEIMLGGPEAVEEYLVTAGPAAPVPTPGLRSLAVYSATGEVLGVLCYLQSGEYARLEGIKCVATEGGATARYVLHTSMVEALIHDEVRLLFADSGISISAGIRYLHQRLGYEIVNLRIRSSWASLDKVPARHRKSDDAMQLLDNRAAS